MERCTQCDKLVPNPTDDWDGVCNQCSRANLTVALGEILVAIGYEVQHDCDDVVQEVRDTVDAMNAEITRLREELANLADRYNHDLALRDEAYDALREENERLASIVDSQRKEIERLAQPTRTPTPNGIEE